MIGKFRRFMKGRRGQGMTEYIIIVALIAIAAIAIYAAFGEQIRQVVSGIGGRLTGDTATTTKTTFDAREGTDMNDFGEE